MQSILIAQNNHNQDIILQVLKFEDEIMSGFSLTKEKLKQCSKEAKSKEGDCKEKNQQNMDRIEKIEIENKKILEYMVSNLLLGIIIIDNNEFDPLK